MRPSRFWVVTLVVLLLLGCALNLYVTFFGHYIHPHWVPYSYTTELHVDDESVEQYSWPSVPDEVTDLGEPNNWIIRRNIFYTEYAFDLGQRNPYYEIVYNLGEYHIGRPLPTRVLKVVSGSQLGYPSEGGQIWPPPPEGEQFGPVDVRYKPLGLILNPIIYALPVWLVLMGVRWALVTRRRRRRARLGLCVGCAYELGELSVCPECGRTIP